MTPSASPITMEMLCQKLGLNNPDLYQCFPVKHKIFSIAGKGARVNNCSTEVSNDRQYLLVMETAIDRGSNHNDKCTQSDPKLQRLI